MSEASMISAGAFLGTENLQTGLMDERRSRSPRGSVAIVTSLTLARVAFECKHRLAPHRTDAVHEEHERVRMQVGQDQEVPHAKHAPSYTLQRRATRALRCGHARCTRREAQRRGHLSHADRGQGRVRALENASHRYSPHVASTDGARRTARGAIRSFGSTAAAHEDGRDLRSTRYERHTRDHMGREVEKPVLSEVEMRLIVQKRRAAESAGARREQRRRRKGSEVYWQPHALK